MGDSQPEHLSMVQYGCVRSSTDLYYWGRGAQYDACPNTVHFDLSVFKNFHLKERWTLQFRVEFFNLTNTPSFAAPNATRGPPAFGTISRHPAGH
jgi:hypothetical protein